MYSRERGGLGVESLTPKREVGVRYLPLSCCGLKQGRIYYRKVLVISRKRWHRADMKEIVAWDVKNLNTKNQAFAAFKAVRHRMVENYQGIE